MTTETILTDEQIRDLFRSAPQEDYTKAGWVGRQRIAIGRAIEQAVLQSEQVQAWKKDAERYQFCRSQTSPVEIHINGVELGLAGEWLDEAMDEEMKEWKP